MSLNYTVKVNKIANPTSGVLGFATLIIEDIISVDGFKICKNKTSGELFVAPPSVPGKSDDEGKPNYNFIVRFVDLRDEGKKDSPMQREIYDFILEEFTKGAPAKPKTAGKPGATSAPAPAKKNPLWGDS